jgi:hypothetical protein
MVSSSKHNPFPYKHDGNRQKNIFIHTLCQLTTFLNEAKSLNITYSMLGNFCHVDEDKELQLEQMGNDACVVVGFNNTVRT